MSTTESLPITITGYDSYGIDRRFPTEVPKEQVAYEDINQMADNSVALENNDSNPSPELTGDLGVDIFVRMIQNTENPNVDIASNAFNAHDIVVRARLNETLETADEVLANALEIEETANKKTKARKAMVTDDCDRRLEQILANEQEAIADLRAKAASLCEIELARKQLNLDAIMQLQAATLVLVEGTKASVGVVKRNTKINLSLQDGHETRRREGFEKRAKYFKRRQELPAIIANNKEELAKLSKLIDMSNEREQGYFAKLRDFEDNLIKERSEDLDAIASIESVKTAFPDATKTVDEQTKQILAAVSTDLTIQLEYDIFMISKSIKYNAATHITYLKSYSKLSLVVSDLELELQNIHSCINEASDKLAEELGTPLLEIESDSVFMLDTVQQIANPLAIKPALPGKRPPSKLVQSVWEAAVDLQTFGTSYSEKLSVEYEKPTFDGIDLYMPEFPQDDDDKTSAVIANKKLLERVGSQVRVINKVVSLGKSGLKGMFKPVTDVVIHDNEPHQ